MPPSGSPECGRKPTPLCCAASLPPAIRSSTTAGITGPSPASPPIRAATAAQISQELGRTQGVIREPGRTGCSGPLTATGEAVVDAAAGSAGYRYELMWSVDSMGWKKVSRDRVPQRCLTVALLDEIILMHVDSASTDAARPAGGHRRLAGRKAMVSGSPRHCLWGGAGGEHSAGWCALFRSGKWFGRQAVKGSRDSSPPNLHTTRTCDPQSL